MNWDAFVEQLPFYALSFAGLLALVAVSWFWARSRFMGELAKYQTEIAKLQLGRNDQLFALEDVCKAKNERIRLILKDLKKQLREKNGEMVRARRNELSNVFVLDYCPAMQAYCRLAQEMFELDREKRQQFIENHLNPFLQLAGDLLQVLNQKKLKDMAGPGALPIRYQYMDFDFAFDFLRAQIRFQDFDLKQARKAHLERLGFERAVKINN